MVVSFAADCYVVILSNFISKSSNCQWRARFHLVNLLTKVSEADNRTMFEFENQISLTEACKIGRCIGAERRDQEPFFLIRGQRFWKCDDGFGRHEPVP